VTEGSIGAIRLVQGINAANEGGLGAGAGYFGEAFLRLFGVSLKTIGALKKLKAVKAPMAGKATGAFDPLAEATGKGLGKFKSVKVTPTVEDLAKIEKHLERFPAGKIENKAMVDRIKKAIAEGRQLQGADAHFYVHELGESGLMKFYMGKGKMSFDDAYKLAHQQMLDASRASPFSVYHPDVIKAHPDQFGPAWTQFWDAMEKAK
jgi:hypothetical protein